MWGGKNPGIVPPKVNLKQSLLWCPLKVLGTQAHWREREIRALSRRADTFLHGSRGGNKFWIPVF